MIIKDKTIVLTGASGGIGHAIAHRLDGQQAQLVLVGRDAEKLNKLNQTLNGQHHTVIADLSTESGRNQLITFCDSLGKIDLLINNAGISEFSQFESVTDEQINKLININLISPMLITKAMMPLLARAKQSYILNVGSSFGAIGYPCFTSYCASKFGLKGFSEALKRELQNETTKVLYIAPRATDTQINSNAVNQLNQQLGNTTDPAKVVALAVLNQLQNESDRVSVGWPEKLFLKINGIFPSLVDKAIGKQLQQIKNFAKLNSNSNMEESESMVPSSHNRKTSRILKSRAAQS
jgi:short-subunit dehydrogenase